MPPNRTNRKGAIMFTGAMANCTVVDENTARRWYSQVLGREPDAEPMTGLLEWHFSPDAGLQVWTEPGFAGRSAAVIMESDLDALEDGLNELGIAHGGIQPGGGARILQLTDPDGNRVVFTGR